MSFNVCNTDVIPRKKQYGFELSILTFAATNVRSLTLKCTIVHFNKVGEVITESDQHYFYLCMKCKENGFRSTDCRYVNCNESINPKVFCTKVYLLPFLFCNILDAQYVSTHFEM